MHPLPCRKEVFSPNCIGASSSRTPSARGRCRAPIRIWREWAAQRPSRGEGPCVGKQRKHKVPRADSHPNRATPARLRTPGSHNEENLRSLTALGMTLFLNSTIPSRWYFMKHALGPLGGGLTVKVARYRRCPRSRQLANFLNQGQNLCQTCSRLTKQTAPKNPFLFPG